MGDLGERGDIAIGEKGEILVRGGSWGEGELGERGGSW